MHHRKNSGIYNLGTGEARTWNDLVAAIFTALGKEKNIEYIPIPEDIREKYQYFTEANMDKLRSIGYTNKFLSVEDAVLDYVKNYLLPGNFD
jgi:ADP-L-glycero-D-manno-heptose 6-epimerase